eukprot:2583771-Lingulodinium_polyedra.AAC.1
MAALPAVAIRQRAAGWAGHQAAIAQRRPQSVVAVCRRVCVLRPRVSPRAVLQCASPRAAAR